MLVMFGFGMTQPAYGDVTHAPDIAQLAADFKETNARHAISPYAQVSAGDSYTFVGVSHPSLATAHTSIGVVLEVLDMETVPNNLAGAAAVFTVSAGETHRVFIVNQSHATINAANSAFTDSQTHLITTTDNTQFGSIKVTGVGAQPTLAHDATRRPGDYTDGGNVISRWDNVSQLSMWGVVYQQSNGAGFALEFIGDMHDSSVSGTIGGYVTGVAAAPNVAATANSGPSVGTLPNGVGGHHGAGRGIN